MADLSAVWLVFPGCLHEPRAAMGLGHNSKLS
jgi:hypothetical protein